MILYVGNKLISKKKNVTGIITLGRLLKLEGFDIVSVSSQQNQVLRLFSMLWAVFKFRNKIRYVLIDTYSTKNFYYALFSSQLCRLLKLKYIPILRGGNLPNRLDISPKSCKRVFSNSYKNVSPSNYLVAEFRIRGYKTTFIPNVLEIDQYKFLERKIESPKLLYVRAFAKIYNPEMAINVLKKLLQTYPKATLCMIGPEKDDSLKSSKVLVKKMQLESHVEFTGMLSKKQWHKKAKDLNVFINTTNIDNTPVSVMEAMALGLPIVSTNVGGIPYLIDNGINGLLVDNNNSDAMVNEIIKICKNTDLAKTLALNARSKVEQFDWEKVKHLWDKILS